MIRRPSGVFAIGCIGVPYVNVYVWDGRACPYVEDVDVEGKWDSGAIFCNIRAEEGVSNVEWAFR
jgi:hypothetical protein